MRAQENLELVFGTNKTACTAQGRSLCTPALSDKAHMPGISQPHFYRKKSTMELRKSRPRRASKNVGDAG